MKTKFNLDREQLDSSYINSRQDFDKVVKGYQALKPPIWKNPWFYGPAGLAGLALIITLTFQNNFFANGNNSTLNSSLQTSSSQIPDDTPCITPLSAKVDIPFEEFNINPKKGGKIVTSNGSVVNIPKNSLIAEEKGNVIIKVREFNDQASAFAAGIPMDYGKKSAFESGGMLEIRGEQDGKSVAINSDKPLKIEMKLHKSGDDFKFWSLDDKTGDWTNYPCKFSEAAVKKPTKEYSKSQIGAALNKVEEEIEVCNETIKTLKAEDEIQEFIPTEYTRKLIIDFEPAQFPELAGYKDIEFEYVHPLNQTASEMKAFEKRVQHAINSTWYSMDISKKAKNYLVTFKNGKETYSLPVRPVLKGASLAQFQQKLNKANKNKEVQIALAEKKKVKLEKEQKALQKKFEEDVKKMEERLNAENSVKPSVAPQRSKSSTSMLTVNNATFTTSTFRVFNCDSPRSYPTPFPQEMVCKTESGNAIKTAGAFVFDLKQNARFSYGDFRGKKIEELGWGRNNSTLIVIDQGGNMFYKREVNKLSLKGNYTVALKRVDRKDVDLEAIKKIISETPVDS